MNLSKSWRIPHTEAHTLQFRSNVFNVANSVRLDAYTLQDESDVSTTFGNDSQTLTQPTHDGVRSGLYFLS